MASSATSPPTTARRSGGRHRAGPSRPLGGEAGGAAAGATARARRAASGGTRGRPWARRESLGGGRGQPDGREPSLERLHGERARLIDGYAEQQRLVVATGVPLGPQDAVGRRRDQR